MSEKDNGGAAFPLPLGTETAAGAEGMTLRDYFAAKAMAAVLGSLSERTNIGKSHPETNMNIAVCAYSLADAMIKARAT